MITYKKLSNKHAIHDLLLVAQKIERGIVDSTTTDYRLRYLWQQPLLLEAFMTMLRAKVEDHTAEEDTRQNFQIICDLICPDFLPVLTEIDALESV